MNDAEAQQQAIRALGDEKVLSEQLWRVNRQRIRLHTWVRWGIGVVALPAAVVVAILAFSSVMLSWHLMSKIGQGPGPGSLLFWGESTPQLTQKMSPDDRLIFESQPSSTQQWKANAQAAADRWPDDPVLRANQVMAELAAQYRRGSPRWDDLKPFLQLCDVGRRAEPDNGFYPLMEAVALLADSADSVKLDVDGPEEVRVILDERGKDPKGQTLYHDFTRYRIRDAAQFREGLALLHEAAGKPRISDYVLALARRRIALLGQPRDFNDVLQETELSISVMLPHLGLIRGAADKATSATVYPELAAMVADDALNARRNSIDDVYRIGDLMMRDAKQSGILIQFMVGKGLADMAVAHAIYSQEHAHSGTRAAELRQYDGTVATMYRAARNGHVGIDSIRTWGAFAGYVTSTWKIPDAAEVRGGRQVEYAVSDSLFVSVTMLLLLGAAILAMAPAWWRRLAAGNGYVPLLPWRATLRTVMPSLLVVIAIIAALNFLPGTNRQYGLRFNGISTLYQYLLLFCIVLLLQNVILLRELGLKGLVAGVPRKRWYYALACIGALAGLLVAGAIRDRATGLNASEPSLTDSLTLLAALGGGLALVLSFIRPKFAWRGSGGRSVWVSGVTVITLIICSVMVIHYTNGVLLPALMLSCAGCVVILSLARHLSAGLSTPYSTATMAAFGPIGILTALALGLICLPALKWQERSSVAAMLSGRTYLMENELNRSTLKEVGDWLLAHPAPLPDGSGERQSR